MMKARTQEATGWRLVRPSGAVVALGAVVVGLAVLAAGCGSGSNNGVAQVGSTNSSATGKSSESASKSRSPMAFAACMRKHGVPNFPDPDSQGRFKIIGGNGPNGQKTGVDTNSSQFKAAAQACRSLQPEGVRPSAQQQAKVQQAMLAFARCMRAHGVPKFPDPKPGGALVLGDKAGVDPNSPQFKSARQACGKLVPGSPLSAPPSPPSSGGTGAAP